MKLQKLVYYGQAWSLVWDEEPLFPERIEAWANGPVVPCLYDLHRGKFRVDQSSIPNGDPSRITEQQRGTVDAVLDFYGHHTAQWLSDLTHLEAPWRETRAAAGVSDGEPCSEEITLAAMAEYYGNLPPAR